MKTRRAGKAKSAPLPPEMPEVGSVEALAGSAEPSVAQAWLTALETSGHLFSAVARRDPRTCDPLPGSLVDLLAALANEAAGSCRPFPHDQLFLAVDLAADPLTELLERHRTRVQRTHEAVPLQRLREVDGRSLAWLARLPGRTMREKLAGKTHALGVKRERTADTAENQLVRAFARMASHLSAERLARAEAHDTREGDRLRAERLRAMLQLCVERMRRSALGDVPAGTRIRPNNVLLSDPSYSRIYRAWHWLRSAGEELARSWAKVPERVRIALFWLTAARLAQEPRIILWDGIARVASGWDGSPFGVERLVQGASGPRWVDEAAIDLLFEADHAPVFIRLSVQEGALVAHLSALEGSGLLRARASTAVRFEVKATPDPLVPRRGISLVVNGLAASERGVDRTFADLAGLRSLAEALCATILGRCGARREAPPRPRTEEEKRSDTMRIGVELAPARLRVNDGGARKVATRGWAAAYELPDGEGSMEWLDGRADRRLPVSVAGPRICSLGDALDPDGEGDRGALALAARRVVEALAEELRAPSTASVAYAVPDAIDELSQRAIRTALGASFGSRVMPVWRSIAAAMAWQLDPTFHKRGPKPGNHVIVVDTELSTTMITLLVARHDAKLMHAFPRSGGVYWERKPPAPLGEEVELRGWQQLLAAYAGVLVTRTLRGAAQQPAADEQQRVVDHLVRTGEVERLIRRGGSTVVEPRFASSTSPAVLELTHDEELFGHELERWLRGLANDIDSLPDSMFASGRDATWLVLVGGVCAVPGFASEARRRLGPMLQRTPHVPIVGLALSSVAAGARECLLRRDAGCPAWREWLPDLFLEVVRDGHYGELRLLDGNNIIDPFFGEARSFPVQEELVLPRGRPWYAFPLIQGKNGGHPLAWEARVASPAFPLDHEVAVALRLSYRYGIDASYGLTLEPTSPDDAPFTRLEARWSRAGEEGARAPDPDVPAFLAGSWGPQECEGVMALTAARRWPGDEERMRGAIKHFWSQGRSLASAPAPVKAACRLLIQRLEREVPRDLADPANIPVALETLCFFHEDAPPEVGSLMISLDEAAEKEVGAGKDAYKRTTYLLGALVGDGYGARRAHLDRLISKVRRYTSFENFDASLARVALSALGEALWRHPRLVEALAEHGDAAPFLVDRARRSLTNLLSSVPLALPRDEDREMIRKRYGVPFRDACEILLAIVRLRAARVGAALRRGTPAADAIAKAVRQLDARFVRNGIACPWRARIGVAPPESLRRMSAVAYALNASLSEGEGTNLVEVTCAD